MQVMKPSWINHGGGPICSIDAHPKGEPKMITGGTNQNQTGIVVIWNLKHVEAALDKIICNESNIYWKMELTSKCINCVRFSSTGDRFVAGGSAQVCIYQLAGSVQSLGSIGEDNSDRMLEKWQCTSNQTLAIDVLHAEWSFDDNMIATCGIDDKIQIWRVTGASIERLRELSGHKTTVKGLSWDPIGRYIATQSVDRSIRIWNSSTWECYQKVTKPFENAPDTAPFIRSHWSPDGAALMCAHATNNTIPVVRVLYRKKKFQGDRDFVGHKRTVACVRASQHLFTDVEALNPLNGVDPKNKKRMATYATLVAAGSLDNAITIWKISSTGVTFYDSLHQRPLVVIRDLFNTMIDDVTWFQTAQHSYVFACSEDSTVATVRLTRDKTGQPLKDSEMAIHLQQIYPHITLPKYANLTHTDDTLMNSLLGIVAADDDPFVKAKSKVKTKKENNEMVVSDKAGEKETSTGVKSTKMNIPFEASIECTPPVCQTQIVTISKDGKKRIHPIYEGSIVSNLSNAEKSDGKHCTTLTETSQSSTLNSVSISNINTSANDNSEVAPTRTAPRKRQHILVSSDEDELEAPSQKKKRSTGITIDALGTQSTRCQTPLNLPALTCKNTYTLDIDDVENTELECVRYMKATNFHLKTTQAYHRIQTFNKSSQNSAASTRRMPMWEALGDGSLLVAQANRNVICTLVIDDSQQHINCYSTNTGALLLPPFLLTTAASRIYLKADRLMVVTTDASLTVWDLGRKKAIFDKISLSPLLAGVAKSIIWETLSDESDAPMVMMDTGKLFTYSTQLCTWILLDDPTSCLQTASSSAIDKTVASNDRESMAQLVQRRNASRLPITGSNRNVTQQMLEWRINAASMIGADTNTYRTKLVDSLINTASASKLLELLRSMSDAERDGFKKSILERIEYKPVFARVRNYLKLEMDTMQSDDF